MSVRSEKPMDAGAEPEPSAAAEPSAPDAGAPAGAPAEEGVAAPDFSALEAELAGLHDRWMRAEAEIQNVRRRATREREESRREIEEQWVLEVAGLLDDLERGIESAREGGAPEAWTRGFDLVRQRIRELLQRHAVEVIDPIGQPFDPRLHEALFEVDAPGGEAQGTIVQVVTRGYARHGRALRAAKVAVARGSGKGGD